MYVIHFELGQIMYGNKNIDQLLDDIIIKLSCNIMQMAKLFLCLNLLCGLATIVASEIRYIIRPSQSQSCADPWSYALCVDNDLTLSQFLHNSSFYLTNNSTVSLIFSPGNYSLESELIVKNVHSFSMFAWPASSSKTVITCGQNARIEFRKVSIVTVSGLEFTGCFENHVLSVGQFQLENSTFFGNGQSISSGTVLTIEESVANFDRVGFLSVLDTPPDLAISPVIGILLKKSNLSIVHSWFEGNNVRLTTAVIYIENDSHIKIVNTTFTNNSANIFSYSDCHTSGILFANAYGHGYTVQIYDSKFIHNVGAILFGQNGNMLITHTNFINNKCCGYCSGAVYVTHTNLTISHSTFTNNEAVLIRVQNGMITSTDHSMFIKNTGSLILHASNVNMISVTHSEFVDNTVYSMLYFEGVMIIVSFSEFMKNNGSILTARSTNLSISHSNFFFNEGGLTTNGGVTSIDHSKFINNIESWILYAPNMSMISVTHSEFVENTVTSSSMLYLDGVMTTVSLSKFIKNRGTRAVVYIPHYTSAENLTNNVFIGNAATYDINISPECRPGLILSFGSSRCIQCSKHWRWEVVGIVVAAFIAGIALVIFMLALNMTVAVGTLNGILFYANIVAVNIDTYFLPFTTPSFITVFISWLNLDVGFDVCIFGNATSVITNIFKSLLQLAFPAYVIFLVIVMIVTSKYSSKFAKIIGKGNPVAVLATLILLSYTKILSTISSLFLSFLHFQPAYGSRSHPHRGGSAIGLFFLPIPLLFAIFSVLVFSWQWLLRFQHKAIFKWVRFQKLRLFLEPYHAPYTAKYRYWTGLLLLVRALLCLLSFLNFSLDPRADLMAVIFVIGGLILLKGVTAKRVYKNWPLDVMETAIYFNLVAFSALTWYNLDFGGNQVVVAYMSVMIIFILLLGVIVFHVLRYTRLYKLSFVEKAFKWTSSKLLEKKPKEQPPNDAPEELDGYQLARSTAGDQELPTVTYSVVEINQPAQNQEENYTG